VVLIQLLLPTTFPNGTASAQGLVAFPHPPGRRSFVELEADAICQWETIERHRLALVPRTFGV
jgi:hypothetical protein